MAGTIGFLRYFDEDERDLTSVHVYSDAEATEHHMEGVAGRVEPGG